VLIWILDHRKTWQHMMQKMQTRYKQQVTKVNTKFELDLIGGWCREAGAQVNQIKASVTWLFLSLNNRFVNQTSTVSLVFKYHKRTQVMIYLWMFFDQSLAYTEHVYQVVTKARKNQATNNVILSSYINAFSLSVIKYSPAILITSYTLMERLGLIQNGVYQIIINKIWHSDMSFSVTAVDLKFWGCCNFKIFQGQK
jgi:hypothetical protein